MSTSPFDLSSKVAAVDTKKLNKLDELLANPELAKRVAEERTYWNDHYSGRKAYYQKLKTSGHWANVMYALNGGPACKSLYYFKHSSALVGTERLTIAHTERDEEQQQSRGVRVLISHDALARLNTRSRKKRERFIIRPASLANIDNDEELCRAFMQGVVSWLNLWQLGNIHRNIGLPNLVLIPSCPSPSWDPAWDFGSTPLFELDVPSSASDEKTHETLRNKIKLTTESYWQNLEQFRAGTTQLDEKALEKRMSVGYWAEEVKKHMQILNLDGDFDVHGTGMQGRAKVVLEEAQDTMPWILMSQDWILMHSSSGHNMSKYQTGHIIRERARVRRGKTSEYVQGPVDDFKAFLYAFSFALFLRPLCFTHNQSDARPCSIEEHTWMDAIRDTGVGYSSTNSICEGGSSRYNVDDDKRSWLRSQLFNELGQRTSSSNTFRAHKLFLSWFIESNRIRMDWMVIGQRISMQPETYLMFWHLWAYKGVAQMLEAYEDHLRMLKKLSEPKKPSIHVHAKVMKEEGVAKGQDLPAKAGGNAVVAEVKPGNAEMKDSAHKVEEVIENSGAAVEDEKPAGRDIVRDDADVHLGFVEKAKVAEQDPEPGRENEVIPTETLLQQEDVEVKDVGVEMVVAPGAGMNEDVTRTEVIENEKKDEAGVRVGKQETTADTLLLLEEQLGNLSTADSQDSEDQDQMEVEDGDKEPPNQESGVQDESTIPGPSGIAPIDEQEACDIAPQGTVIGDSAVEA